MRVSPLGIAPRGLVPMGVVLCCLGCPSPQTQPSDRAELVERLSVAEARLAELQAERTRLVAERERLRERIGQLADLEPEDRAAAFRVRGVELGRFTGGKNWDEKPGDDGLRVYVFPVDQTGDRIKRLGTITVELFDLALEDQDRRIGLWRFDHPAAAERWRSNPFLYGYYFQLPWQGVVPAHRDLEVRVTFVALDGSPHVATREVTIDLPPRD